MSEIQVGNVIVSISGDDVHVKERRADGRLHLVESYALRQVWVRVWPVDQSENEREKAFQAMAQERAQVVVLLRELCADFGDNDWPDNLHLYDVIEKHLARRLHEGQ